MGRCHAGFCAPASAVPCQRSSNLQPLSETLRSSPLALWAVDSGPVWLRWRPSSAWCDSREISGPVRCGPHRCCLAAVVLGLLVARCGCPLGVVQAVQILSGCLVGLQEFAPAKTPHWAGLLDGVGRLSFELNEQRVDQPSSLAGSASSSLSSASMIITAAGLPAANLTRPSR